jgi:hypothetical protein
MRDRIIKITDEVGKLLDLQNQLLKKRTFLDLAPGEVDDYHARRDRIRQLCSELTDLHS